MANMIHVKYFFPLTMEGNRRGIKSKYWLFWDKKPVNEAKTYGQHPASHLAFFDEWSKKLNFEFNICSNDNGIEGVTFFGERRGINNLSKANRGKQKRIVLTCFHDFAAPDYYDWYVGQVDNVIFVSKWMAEKYGKTGNKNLYLGSPKYDVKYNREEILKKYGIATDKKIAVVFLPNDTMSGSFDPIKICAMLKRAGFYVVAKYRHYFQDAKENIDLVVGANSWFPHPGLELISISDIVILFNSSANKECVLLGRPYINFNVTTKKRPFTNLLEYSFCRELPPNCDDHEFDKVVGYLSGIDHSKQFSEARAKYFFEPGNVSGKILEAVS